MMGTEKIALFFFNLNFTCQKFWGIGEFLVLQYQTSCNMSIVISDVILLCALLGMVLECGDLIPELLSKSNVLYSL